MSLNSMFSRRFTQWPLSIALGVKDRNFEIILSPRGMLAQGALSLKPLKKRIYLNAFRLLGVHRRLIWQATSNIEKIDIQKEFGRSVPVFVVPNLPAPVAHQVEPPQKLQKSANFISVARITPVKNTLAVIRAFARVMGDVSLSFLGPIEDQTYFEICRSETKTLPGNVKVHWLPEREPEAIASVLAENHFFISATLGENFGHAIFEALAAGKPVIISDRTQWRNLEENHAGFDISLENPEEWCRIVALCIDMKEEEYRKTSLAAHSFAVLFRNNAELIQKNLNLFGAI